jgi:hypothetical protein
MDPNRLVIYKIMIKYCECGCGEPITKEGNRFITGHNRRGKIPHNKGKKMLPQVRTALLKANTGIKQSKETCEKKSRSLYGRKLSEEHKTNIRKSIKKDWKLNRENHNAGILKMTGGDDIIKHHYIYDESDLSLYTIEMTRAKHTEIHHAMRREGIIVPHINIKEVL